MTAHLDPELFARWVGPDGLSTTIEVWDARDGGERRYTATSDGVDHGFRGCFHQITDTRIVQTFTWEGMPDDVSLETLWFEDLGDGTTRLYAPVAGRQLRGPRRMVGVGHGDRRQPGLCQA